MQEAAPAELAQKIVRSCAGLKQGRREEMQKRRRVSTTHP
jgi:hypothetical protein